ncbi:MAG: DoxX family protein [Cyclobacteriaceae bacterium]
MKKFTIIYWVVAVAFSGLMIFQASNFLFNSEEVTKLIAGLGYGALLIKPLTIAKILGVVAVISRVSPKLREWAYVGFFFDFGMATYSHILAGDGMFMMPLLALALLLALIYTETKAYARGSESAG